MRLRNILIALVMAVLLQGVYSCIDDKGNYSYIDKETLFPVTISGFEDTTVVMRTVLNIDPVLNNMDDTSRYIHLWYALPTNVAGYTPKRDTLSLERKLSFTVTYETGTYKLVYELRDPKLDIYTYKDVRLTVQSDLGAGWYILKEENGETDIDYVTEEGVLKENLLASSGQERLKGKPVKMYYQSSRYSVDVENPDGTVTRLSNQRAFHVLSDQDMRTFNADNMGVFYDYEHYFYETPEVCRPQNFGAGGSYYYYAINAGKLHSLYTMSANNGKLGYARPGMYELHSDMLLSMNAAMVFDKTTSTFYNSSAAGTAMDVFGNAPAGSVSSTEMDTDLICLLTKKLAETSTGYALMKNKNKDEYYLFNISHTMAGYPFTSVDTVPSNCEILAAEVRGASIYASAIYYAKSKGDGDVLKVYKDSREEIRESELISFPGEKIAYIENIESLWGVTPAYNRLLILTNSSAGWKLYLYDTVGQTPELEETPVLVYSGRGKAGYAILR